MVTPEQRAELRRLATQESYESEKVSAFRDWHHASVLVMHDAPALLDTIDTLEAKLADAEERNHQGHCVYCGHRERVETQDELELVIARHIKECPRHPLNRVAEAVAAATSSLEAQNAALEARAIAAEQSLETLRLRAEVMYASASALLADANGFCGVRDEAVGTEVKS